MSWWASGLNYYLLLLLLFCSKLHPVVCKLIVPGTVVKEDNAQALLLTRDWSWSARPTMFSSAAKREHKIEKRGYERHVICLWAASALKG